MNNMVLVADDDQGIVRLLRQTLEPMGLRVCETYDAISALSLIQRQPPDLIVMDVNMPSGNGLSACEMLATDKWLNRLPVIILTDRNDDATRQRCQTMNAHYIHKGPDAVLKILELVRQIIPKLTEAPAKREYLA